MSEIWGYIVALVCLPLGALIGWMACKLRYQNDRSGLISSLAQLEERSRLLQEELDRSRNELPKTLHEWLAAHADSELAQKKDSLLQAARENLGTMLEPIKDKLFKLSESVTSERTKILEQRDSVLHSINRFSADYQSLVSVLRGNIKVQGNWGEISLRRLFESAGLLENQDYVMQSKDIKLKDDAGNQQRPDATVYLPQGKSFIIDAKCPLQFYEECVNHQNDPVLFKQSLDRFCQALKTHIDDLSKRAYQKNTGLATTPDFVVLFLPMDGIWPLIVEYKSNLLEYASTKKVVITTPAMLLMSMHTIASLWQLERQNRNTSEIIERSSSMYDKLVSFVEDLRETGTNLNKARTSYDNALHRLSTGHDSLISRAQKLKELGVKGKKDDAVLESLKSKYGQEQVNFTNGQLLTGAEDDAPSQDE